MKILLIAPYNQISGDLDVEGWLYMKKMFLAPPLGLHRIANYLRPQHDVVVYDPIAEDDPYEFLKLIANRFDIIGFSLTHHTLENDLSLIWAAKRANPKALLVVGGEEATFNSQLIEEYSPVDIIVQGEGEFPMATICNGKIQKGIIHGDPLDFTEFKRVTLGMDFDSIPYEDYWEMLERKNKNFQQTRMIRMFTTNYCPRGCAFCSSTNFLRNSYEKPVKVVYIDADNLVKMVLSAVETHLSVETIFFQDDNFLLGQEGRIRAELFCYDIIKLREKGAFSRKLTFMCQADVRDVNLSLLRLMKRAGFRMISYGIESFSQNILNDLGKSVTVEENEETLRWTIEAEIRPFVNLIFTSPNCTYEDVLETFVNIKLWEKDIDLGINLYVIPFAGAEMTKVEKANIKYREVQIPGTLHSFKKAEYIVPKDRRVRNLLDLTQRNMKLMLENDYMTSAKKSAIILKALFMALEGEKFYESLNSRN